MSNSKPPSKSKEAVMINELLEYVYFNTVYILLETGGTPSSLKGFRFESTKESEMWKGEFQYQTTEKKLLFYTFLEELRVLEKERVTARDKIENIMIYNLRCIITAGILVDVFGMPTIEKFLEVFDGEDGDALSEFISHGHTMKQKYKTDLFWASTPKAFDDSLYVIFSHYRKSTFLKVQHQYIQKTNSILDTITSTGILEKFFSLKGDIIKHIPDFVPSEYEDVKSVIFVEKYPLWASKNGDNSYYSFFFSKKFLTDDAIFFYRHLESFRLYLEADAGIKNKIRESAIQYAASATLDRSKSIIDISGGEMLKLSQIFLAGNKISDIRRFLILAMNQKILSKMENEIDIIISNEMIATYNNFEKTDAAGRMNDEVAKEYIELFFTNIFNQIKELFTTKEPLIYSKLNAEEHILLTKQLSNMIKRIIKEKREYGGWLT